MTKVLNNNHIKEKAELFMTAIQQRFLDLDRKITDLGGKVDNLKKETNQRFEKVNQR